MIEILIIVAIGLAFLTTVKISLEITYKDDKKKKLSYTPEEFKLPEGITFTHIQEIIRDAHEIELDVLLKAFGPLEKSYQRECAAKVSGGWQPLPTLLDLRNPPKPPPRPKDRPLYEGAQKQINKAKREIALPYPELIEDQKEAPLKLTQILKAKRLPYPSSHSDPFQPYTDYIEFW